MSNAEMLQQEEHAAPQNMEGQKQEEQQLSAQDEFASGFLDDVEDAKDDVDGEKQVENEAGSDAGEKQPVPETHVQQAEQSNYQELLLQQQQQQILQQQQLAQQQVQQQAPQAEAKQIELSDDAAQELENLKKISPAAAILALEDSPDGEMIRERLENLGAVSAHDRADIIFAGRKQEQERQQKIQNDALAQQRHMESVMQSELPDVYAMSKDPSKAHERMALFAGIKTWIENKPYAQGAKLMNTFEHATNPNEIVSLIKQYRSETSKPAVNTGTGNGVGSNGGSAQFNQQDLAGAFVPPSGTNNLTPKGMGDKNSFDAGFLID